MIRTSWRQSGRNATGESGDRQCHREERNYMATSHPRHREERSDVAISHRPGHREERSDVATARAGHREERSDVAISQRLIAFGPCDDGLPTPSGLATIGL
ncbi:MAG: hypothetical protein U5K38_13625 [Woeseiaceae bacterium]|nr:hypothetical protein [Woeseiaceae bacterium]